MSASLLPLLLAAERGTGGYASFLGFLPDSGHGVVVSANTADREVDTIGLKLLRKLSAEED